jgi:SAM-dependent methyltransferase
MYVLLILSTLFVVNHTMFLTERHTNEGFSQTDRFVAKYDADIYDEFYNKVYDTINVPTTQLKTVLAAINTKPPDKSNDVFLDVGCGTGTVLNELYDKGYNVYGLDKSESMVEYCIAKNPELNVKQGDALEPMVYDKGTITHILCTDFTIYQIEDKASFFRNCYFWLKPYGRIFIHLVDKHKYNPVPLFAKPQLFEDIQNYSTTRVTNSEVDFVDYRYKSDVKINDKTVILTETFVDSSTANIRQNQQTLYVDSVKDILNTAQYSGFIVTGQLNMKESKNDEYQYIYILERPM